MNDTIICCTALIVMGYVFGKIIDLIKDANKNGGSKK